MDDSVMLGFVASGSETVKLIVDKDLGELRPGDFQSGDCLENPKITYHASGYYKLASKVTLPSTHTDRCTIIGPPLNEIKEPRRMLEVLFPQRLRTATDQPNERDIILDASSFPLKPLRCTVFCMPTEKFRKINELKERFVDTSEYEFVHGLEHGSTTWAFILRVSFDDTLAPENFTFFVPGEIKWGSPEGDI